MVCASLLLQNVVAAAEPGIAQAITTKVNVADVRLDQHGALAGQLVDRQGAPVADSIVTLWSGGKVISRCATSSQGQFQFAGIRGGLYQVAAQNTGGVYRVWTNRTAPPASKPGILLIQGAAVRGQCDDCMYANCACSVCQAGFGGGHYGGSVIRALNNPWLLGGLVAAGVAVPIAISNSDDSDGS
jgi:hypothetical protein